MCFPEGSDVACRRAELQQIKLDPEQRSKVQRTKLFCWIFSFISVLSTPDLPAWDSLICTLISGTKKRLKKKKKKKSLIALISLRFNVASGGLMCR